MPFLAETLWQNLAGVFSRRQEQAASQESVHLCDYPTGDATVIDEALSARMNLVREISRSAATPAAQRSLKVRQPLAKVEVILADTTHQTWLEEHAAVIAEELNVKAVEFTTDGRTIRQLLGRAEFQAARPAARQAHAGRQEAARGSRRGAKLLAELTSTGKIDAQVPDGSSIALDNEDIEVRLQAKAGLGRGPRQGLRRRACPPSSRRN